MMHEPVMLSEVLDAMKPQAGGCYVDATFGAGGYSRAVLEAADCRVVALDRDPEAALRAEEMKDEFQHRLLFAPGCFSQMEALLASLGVTQCDGIMFDVGVSSMQIDAPGRGFSFMRDGPLDMRMSLAGQSAADVVAGMEEGELARVIAAYGEEKKARAVARAIVRARGETPIETTTQLAEIVRRAVGPSRTSKVDAATRTFQALRIYVNRELEELEAALMVALRLLRSGGRLVVVSFHSLEDRLVKHFIRSHARGESVSRHMPEQPVEAPLLREVTMKAVLPSEAETQRNKRARSAKLRVAERTAAPLEAEAAR